MNELIAGANSGVTQTPGSGLSFVHGLYRRDWGACARLGIGGAWRITLR